MTDGITDTKVKKISYKFDIAFLLVFLIVCAGQPFFVSYMEYLGGLTNSCGRGFWLMFIYWPLKLSLLAFWLILSLSMIFQYQRVIKYKTVKAALIILSFLFLLIPPVYNVSPLARVFLKGYEKWVIKNVNINAIQQWLATEGVHYKDQRYRYDFPKEFPAFLTEFKPKFIWFDTSNLDGVLYIEFGWGGGMGSWGVRIGPPNMKIPQEVSQVSESRIEYIRPIAPGVYIFDGG